MDLTPPRGTRDLLPPEAGRMRHLYQRAADAARRFGYRYIETPAFEQTELFRRTSGESSDVVRKEMYTFEDRRGRLLTLRPEATAPIVRAYLEHGRAAPGPFKVFTMGSMWRYGRPQSGRYREFRQFDVEVVGEEGPSADVEVIAVGDAFLKDADVGSFDLQVNSIGDENCRPAYREELLAFLGERRDLLQDEHRDRFEENPLRVLDCKDEACRKVAGEAPKLDDDRLCDPCREHFAGVMEGLQDEGIPATRTLTLVRGLDYYTRTTFEWVSGGLAAGQNSVGGGGRYDGLAEVLGGPHTPAVGFAIGIDRVDLAWLNAHPGQAGADFERPDAFVIGVGEDGWREARAKARFLRQAGLSAQLPFAPRPIGDLLKLAGRVGARYALIVGDDEIRTETVTLRRLSDGDQERLRLDQAIERMAAPEAAR